MRPLLIKLFVLPLSLISLLSMASPVDVEVVYSKRQDKPLELQFSGNVTAKNDAQLASWQSGLVKSVEVDAGDLVQQGQVLLKLDDELVKLQLLQAQAELTSADARYQEHVRLLAEINDLAQKQVVAKTILSERKSNVAISQAALAQAKAKVKMQQTLVERHVLRAPFSGFIAERFVDVGEWVSSQSQVFQLVSDQQLRVVFDIPQEYFSVLNRDLDVTANVTSDADSNWQLQLPLSQIVAVSNPVSRSFQARVDLPANSQLVSGMSASIKLRIETPDQSQMVLPKSALKRHPDGSYSVFTIENNQAQRVGVDLLRTNVDQVYIEGVENRAAVVVSSESQLTQGTPVTITNEQGE